MADLTRSISITVPDAYVTRVQAYVAAMPELMIDSGTVDGNGDPIMIPAVETAPVKFDRIAGDVLKREMKLRILQWEQHAARSAITEVVIS